MLIIRLVRSRPYISLEELVREIECAMAYYDDEGTAGVSRRTVLRDIGDIRSGLGVSIEYSRSEGGYYIPEDEDRISDLERVLEQFDLITSLRAREELSSIVFAEKRKAAGTEHLSPLIYAVKKHLEVESLFFALQAEHRSAQAELNGMMHEVERTIAADKEEKSRRWNAALEQLKADVDLKREELDRERNRKRKDVEALKIVSPDNLRPIYEKLRQF